MADDAIFDSPSPQQTDDTVAEGPSAADLTRQLALGIAQAQAPLHQEIAAMRQEMAALRQQGQGGTAASAGHTPGAQSGEGDMVSRFIANPEQTIGGEISRVVGPVLQPVLDAVQEPIVDKERARVVARYGPKYWEEVVEPRFRTQQANLRQTNPAATANPQAIRYIISSIVGSEDLADVTETHRQSTAKAAAEAAKRNAKPPSFVGGAGRGQFSGEADEPIPQEDAEFIAKLGRAGYKWSEADYRAARGKPRDMEERYQQELAAERANRRVGAK